MLKLKTMLQTAIASLFLFSMLGQPLQAGMVGTADLLDTHNYSQNIDSKRESMRQQLVDLGVDPQQADIRVAGLSDNQINEISQRISDLPAGADAGGVILTIFIVFVITDVIGATDIFPFIKPVK